MSRLFTSGGQRIGTYSGLIYFRIDLSNLFAVQGTLKSLSQSQLKSINSLAFIMIQLSHSYMTTGKTIALTIQTFVSKVMSLLFNTLCRFVIAFLPRSKHLLISWLQSPSAQEKKHVAVSTFPPSICHQVMEQDAVILAF